MDEADDGGKGPADGRDENSDKGDHGEAARDDDLSKTVDVIDQSQIFEEPVSVWPYTCWIPRWELMHGRGRTAPEPMGGDGPDLS